MSAGEPALIRTRPHARCVACGETGRPTYSGLRDRLFDAPGTWSIAACPNPACGMLWLDPMPLEADLAVAYRRYFTHEAAPVRPPADSWWRRRARARRERYLADHYGYRLAGTAPPRLLGRSAWRARLGDCAWPVGRAWLGARARLGGRAWLGQRARLEAEAAVMDVPFVDGGRWLDVGCGDGRSMRELARLGWRVEGIDLDPVAVEHARTAGGDARVGKLEEQSYPDETFDVVALSHCLEHLADPLRTLREIHRVLRPGGRLSILTPNARSAAHRRFGPAWLALDPPRHLFVFTLAALERIVAGAGLRIVRARTTARGAGQAFAASRSIARSGRWVPGTRAPGTRGWARAGELIVALALRRDATAGEEIALVAEKAPGVPRQKFP